MTDWLHAYIDETGTNTLDTSKNGVSKYFICVAVIIDPKNVDHISNHLDGVAEKLCGGAEIASKSIGGKIKRRSKFLNELTNLKFGYFGLLIRKDAVFKESGLKHKQSFYKCINKMLYERISKSGRPIKIIADTIGGKDFMDSFEGYLEEQLKPDLFFDYTHEFRDSSKCRLIQLADLIAGTLSQCFEPEKRTPDTIKFRETLTPFELDIDVWPPKRGEYNAIVSAGAESPVDDQLKAALITRVYRLIDTKGTSKDEIELMQVHVLRRLLFAWEFEGHKLISSDRLIHLLAEQGFDPISKRAFTKNIVGRIRKAGIIVAGTLKGYRLAFSESEIGDYLEHNKSIIEPMLARLAEARKSVRMDTANRIDIFHDERYQLLAQLVDCSSIVEDPE